MVNADTYIECVQKDYDWISPMDGSYIKKGEVVELLSLTMRIKPDGHILLGGNIARCLATRSSDILTPWNPGWDIKVTDYYYLITCWDEEEKKNSHIYNINRYSGKFTLKKYYRHNIYNQGWHLSTERRGMCSVKNKKF